MDWGAVIQAIGTLGSAALNYGANERTNSTNRFMNRENNELNERLWREQLQWNEDMYNKYQSPEMQLKSQMKGMQDLGLNPNLMLGHAAGSAGGVAGATPPQMVASRDVAPQIGLDLSPLAKYALTDAQRDNLQASTDAQLIKNRFAVMRERYELEEKLVNTKLTDTQRQHLKQQITMLDIESRYQEDYLKARNDSQRQDAALKRSEAALNAGKIEYQNYMNKAFPATSEAQMRVMNAQVYNLIQSGLAAGASIQQIKANCAKLMADKLNVEQDTENKKQQNNLNKPNEILSEKESKDLNNDPKENDIYHGLDMLFKYVLPIKRMFN